MKFPGSSFPLVGSWLAIFILISVGSMANAEDQDVAEQAQEILSTEDLFDILEVTNPDKEERFPPLRQVSHYHVSWSSVMSLHVELNETSSTNTHTLDDFLAFNPTTPFLLQLQLSCPLASRIVLGLVDANGQRPQMQQSRHSQQQDVPVTSSNGKSQDSFACRPPIDMSRNVLQCRGIPSNELIEVQRDVNKEYDTYNSLFKTSFEVSCLSYIGDDTNFNATNFNGEADEQPQDDLGLVLSTRKQQIKSRSNLVFTESLYAGKITNLSEYLKYSAFYGETITDDQDLLDQSQQSALPLQSFVDSTDFWCQQQPTSKPSSSRVSSGQCSNSNDKSTKVPGFCTRHVTCYYSAQSDDVGCKSTVGSMVLSAVRDQDHENVRKLFQNQYLEESSDGDSSISSVEDESNAMEGSNVEARSSIRMLASNQWIFETRYRILWTHLNFGCDTYPVMLEITCEKADSIVFRGSTAGTMKTSQDTNTYRHTQPQTTTFNPTEEPSVLECHPSLFQENTLHCRHIIPSTTSSQRHPETYHVQDALTMDISCIQRIADWQDIIPNVVQVKVLETSNIKCQPTGTLDGGFTAIMPALTGSAFTVVPLTVQDDEDYVHNSEQDQPDSLDDDDTFVIFPPPNAGVLYDPSTSVTCWPCQDDSGGNNDVNYDYFINYNNTIGNKVSQLVRGCQVFASCQVHDTGNGSLEGLSSGRSCINTIAPLSLTFQDSNDIEFSSRFYPASSSSPQKLKFVWFSALFFGGWCALRFLGY